MENPLEGSCAVLDVANGIEVTWANLTLIVTASPYLVKGVDIYYYKTAGN